MSTQVVPLTGQDVPGQEGILQILRQIKKQAIFLFNSSFALQKNTTYLTPTLSEWIRESLLIRTLN